MNVLSDEFLHLSRTAVAIMVLFILVIKWIIKTRQEKSESILNLSRNKDQMNKAKQMENERSFITTRLKTLFQPQDDE